MRKILFPLLLMWHFSAMAETISASNHVTKAAVASSKPVSPAANIKKKEADDKLAKLFTALVLANFKNDKSEIRRLKRQIYFNSSSCQQHYLPMAGYFSKMTNDQPIKGVQCAQVGPDRKRVLKEITIMNGGKIGQPARKVKIEFDFGNFNESPTKDNSLVVGAKVFYYDRTGHSVSHVDTYKRFENGRYIGKDPSFVVAPPQKVDVSDNVHMTQYRQFSDKSKSEVRIHATIHSSKPIDVVSQSGAPLVRRITQIKRLTDQPLPKDLPTLQAPLLLPAHDIFLTLKRHFGLHRYITTMNCCNEAHWKDTQYPNRNSCQQFIDYGLEACNTDQNQDDDSSVFTEVSD